MSSVTASVSRSCTQDSMACACSALERTAVSRALASRGKASIFGPGCCQCRMQSICVRESPCCGPGKPARCCLKAEELKSPVVRRVLLQDLALHIETGVVQDCRSVGAIGLSCFVGTKRAGKQQ